MLKPGQVRWGIGYFGTDQIPAVKKNLLPAVSIHMWKAGKKFALDGTVFKINDSQTTRGVQNLIPMHLASSH